MRFAAWQIARVGLFVASLTLVPAPALPAQHPFQLRRVPRFTDDTDRSLIVYERGAGVPSRDALTISLESDPVSGRRQIRLVGRQPSDPALRLECDGAGSSVPLTHSVDSTAGTIGTYVVADAVAAGWLSASKCTLHAAGADVAIPIDLARVAWRAHPRSTASTLLAEPVAVFDSDTITVRIDGRLEALHYIGVDAPTLYPAKGAPAAATEAARANQELLRNRILRLELDAQERDGRGRLLAYVYAGETMVNAELIRRGLARASAIPPNTLHASQFVALEREARANSRGLWKATSSGPASGVPGGPGTEPISLWTCPLSHPVKGRLVVEEAMRCKVTGPESVVYAETRPDRCYVDAQEADRDGCGP